MRIRWPGEPNPGVLIDVPVFSNNKNTEASRAIVAKETNRVSYPVVANEKRFKAYLKATGTIRIDLLDGVTLSSVGHATISLSAVGTTLPGELARSIPILMGGRKPLRESATKRIGSLTFSMITTYETTKQQLRRKETPSQAVEDRRRRNKEMVRFVSLEYTRMRNNKREHRYDNVVWQFFVRRSIASPCHRITNYVPSSMQIVTRRQV